MKIFLLATALSLSACTVPQVGSVNTIPVVSQVCTAVNGSTFDTVLRAYDAAEDAVILLLDTKVLKPGTPTALAVANANDRVLAALTLAEGARAACNSNSYLSALAEAQAGIVQLRIALHK